MNEPTQHQKIKTERAFVGPLFYMIAGSIISTLIYGELHHEEIRKSLKPTFTISTPWGITEILTPWGTEKPTPPTQRIYTKGYAIQPQATKYLNLPPQINRANTNGTDRPTVNQQTIFKCTDAHGTTFQNMPCGTSR